MAGCSPGQDLALECHLSNVEPVAKQMGERTARERDAADGLSGLQGADLGDDALLAQVGHQQVEAAEPADSCGRWSGPARPQPH